MGPGHAPDLAVSLDQIREAVVSNLWNYEPRYMTQRLLGIERAGQRLTELGQEALVRLDPLRVVDVGRGAEPFDDFPGAVSHRGGSTEEPAIAAISGPQP